MSLPAGILADGETIEIPFEAYDQNGDKITNFTTLARNEQFNALTFNASTGTLVLSEKDDGTAKLSTLDTKAPGFLDPQQQMERQSRKPHIHRCWRKQLHTDAEHPGQGKTGRHQERQHS